MRMSVDVAPRVLGQGACELQWVLRIGKCAAVHDAQGTDDPDGSRERFDFLCDRWSGGESVGAASDIERTEGRVLRVEVESLPPAVMGCPSCGVVAHAHGRQLIELIDAPCFTTPVRLVWRKRRWRCPESSCPVTSFMEQDPAVVPARALLTCRATSWAIGQLRRENASVQGLARQLGCSWKTLWRSIRPVLEAAADDEASFAPPGHFSELTHHRQARTPRSRPRADASAIPPRRQGWLMHDGSVTHPDWREPARRLRAATGPATAEQLRIAAALGCPHDDEPRGVLLRETVTVSSIGSNGLVYFRGGNGKCGWPANLRRINES